MDYFGGTCGKQVPFGYVCQNQYAATMEFIKVIDRYGETLLINVDHIAVIREDPNDKKVEITLSILEREGKRNERIRTSHTLRDVEAALKPKPLDDQERGGFMPKAAPKKTKKDPKEKK